MPVVDLMLTVLAVAVLVPLAVLAAECVAALLPPRRAPVGARLRCAILVPAHNEEGGLPHTLAELLPQLAPGDRLLVVADNCSDRTAAVARAAGAEAVDRFDGERRGKGYALAFGVGQLAADPPAVVVIVDADCRTPAGTLDALVRAVTATNRPVQAAYTLDPPADAGPRARLSAYAFRFKNVVRPTGLDRLGMPCLLTGSGMAFPYAALRDAPLASGNIVEDMRLGVDLAIAGHAPRFLGSAQVGGELPTTANASAVQRTRWEHGHLRTLLAQCPRLVVQALIQRRPDLLALALELGIPPLSVLGLAIVVAFTAAIVGWLAGGSAAPTIILSGGVLVTATAMIAAWAKHGRATLPLTTLLAAPWYVLAKLPIYVAFLVKPQRDWVRTERTGEKGA